MLHTVLLRGVSAGAVVLALSSSLVRAQEALPAIEIGAGQSAPASEVSLGPPWFGPEHAKLPIYSDPPGQTVTTVNHKFLETTPMLTVQEMLRYSPGMTFIQGIIPRDFVISIRGSGTRVFAPGVRNIMMFEDGFPITTADGNGRTDILDPHSY